MAGYEEARRLLAKAADDEYVLDRLLDDAAAPDSVVGFHAQQAAEKLLKAALFSAGVAPPRTHNLAVLVDLATDHHLNLPPGCDELRWLTPYAVLYRYGGEAGEEEEPLAREQVRERICRLRGWVEKRLAASEPQQ